MTADDIWYKIYEQKNPSKTEQVSALHKRLFYFIDFTIDVDMGGFVYNKTPSQPGDNFYLPYIESLKFFGFIKVADMLNEFNLAYINALANSENSDGWYEMCVQAGMEPLMNALDAEIYRIADNERGKVTDWIEKNLDELTKGLK